MATALGSGPWKKDLEDDTVEYFVFPKMPTCSSKSDIVNFLKGVKDSCMSIVQNDLELYIWQNESFALHIPPETSYTLNKNSQSKDCASSASTDSGKDVLPPFLCGRTCYGDCADDEWFIVYLLRRLTQELPGLVASSSDVHSWRPVARISASRGAVADAPTCWEKPVWSLHTAALSI